MAAGLVTHASPQVQSTERPADDQTMTEMDRIVRSLREVSQALTHEVRDTGVDSRLWDLLTTQIQKLEGATSELAAVNRRLSVGS